MLSYILLSMYISMGITAGLASGNITTGMFRLAHINNPISFSPCHQYQPATVSSNGECALRCSDIQNCLVYKKLAGTTAEQDCFLCTSTDSSLQPTIPFLIMDTIWIRLPGSDLAHGMQRHFLHRPLLCISFHNL